MPKYLQLMDLSKIQSFALLEEKMKYLADRQQIISENFANADTPGYRRKDIKSPDFDNFLQEKLSMVSPVKTNPSHLSSIEINTLNGREIISSKNKVQLDIEALEMMKNNSSFAEASSTYKKMLSLIKEATGSSSSR